MSEKIITAVFKVESEAYKALSELRRHSIGNDYIISQAALVTNEGGRIITKDWFDTGVETRNDARIGGLLGAMLGIFAGPLGMLWTGTWGYLIGSAKDAGDMAENVSVLENVSGQLVEGETALLILAQENVPNVLESELGRYSVSIIVNDAAEVMAEVEDAQKIEREMARDAKRKMREEKIASRREKVEGYRDRIKESFSNIGHKK